MKKQSDPNIHAYLQDVKNGKFKDFAPGTWVAYYDGKFVFSHPSKKEFLTKLRKIQAGCFIAQVNITEVFAKVRGPRLVKNIKRKENLKRA